MTHGRPGRPVREGVAAVGGAQQPGRVQPNRVRSSRRPAGTLGGMDRLVTADAR